MGIVIGLCHLFAVVLLRLAPLYVGHVRDLSKNGVAFRGFLEDHPIEGSVDFFDEWG
jgi:hypothetical protein